MDADARPFPVIAGPTAGGKSALAQALAGAIARAGGAAEILSADAFQVYRGLDIGTAKPSAAERAATPHHLIDIRDPREAFSVDQWLRLANPLIDELRGRGVTPIVVGGTHFYIKALLEGLFEGPPADPAVRAELAALPLDTLRAELERADPAAAARLHPNDRRRTVRALEVYRRTGEPISAMQQQWDAQRRPDARLIILDWPAQAINRRINARVRAMIDAGLIDEARALHDAGALGPQAREAIGYKQLIEHFEGRSSLDDAIERIKIDTRRFAKNQRTWLRRLSVAPAGAPAAITLPGAEADTTGLTFDVGMFFYPA